MKKYYILLLSIIIILASLNIGNAKRPLVVDLSNNVIKIHANFSGTDILLFGTKNTEGDIVVVVRGPAKNYIVRKKEKVAGIWINNLSVEFEGVNSFYSVSASKPLNEFNNDKLLAKLEINPTNIYYKNIKKNHKVKDIEEFKQALLEYKQEKGLYNKRVDEITLNAGTLFRVAVRFPGNIQKGSYVAETYLINQGRLISKQITPIEVVRSGLEDIVYDTAISRSYLYGFVAVMVAIIAGLLAGLIFNRIK